MTPVRRLLLALVPLALLACGTADDPGTRPGDGGASGETGGSAAGGAAGNSATGGANATGGHVTPTGGSATGGATGGAQATGGSSSGGATGGLATGGAHTGGTGGGATGGAATGGAAAVPACPAALNYVSAAMKWPPAGYNLVSLSPPTNPNDFIRVKYTATGLECVICHDLNAGNKIIPNCTLALPPRFVGGPKTEPGQCVQSEAECPITKCFNSGDSADMTVYPCN